MSSEQTTAEKLTDRITDGERPAVDEIAKHFADTIFWNWGEPVSKGLDDESRIECEFPFRVRSLADLEDEATIHSLIFESGELTLTVGTIHEGRSDETAREVDAQFVACLPVYLPVLFREIASLREQLAAVERKATLADKLAKAVERMKTQPQTWYEFHAMWLAEVMPALTAYQQSAGTHPHERQVKKND